jgi:hypothetical protein
MTTLCASRQRLLASLHGQSLDIPDLRVIFQHWPEAASSHLEVLELDASERLLR